MMFKKGSFEIGGTIYPVAIKVSSICCISNHRLISSSPWCYWLFITGTTRVSVYFRRASQAFSYLIFCLSVSQYDPRFGDAFWHSSKYNMVSYLLRTMTSWAIVVNVWYLPPMTIQV